jgi:SAM-dependent methyltransferase
MKAQVDRPSKKHTNRKAHNWLAYNIGDKCLKEKTTLYNGILYDLGCGEAPYKDFFLLYADKYVGVDWAGSYHNTNADISADLNKPLPIESGIADTVVSLSVLEHLCEPQTMLNEAYRILKKGGVMVLQVPWQWWVHEAPHDYFRYTPYGLKYMCAKAGFVDICVAPTAGFFSMFILKFNYFSARFVMGPRPFRWAIKALLIPMWYAGQWAAPILDKLDRNWQLEAAGYNVTARKPYKG